MYIHTNMCNYTDVVWIGQPDDNEQLVSREAPGSTILVQWYERATHHGVGVQSVRHITGSAYERATHHGVGVRACDTSWGRRTSLRHITGSAYEKRAVENNCASVMFQCGMWSETTT